MPTSKEIISSTQSNEYVISRLSKDNLADVAKLHAEVYGTAAANDYFLKKYNTAYTGVEYVGFIAYNTNTTPVAYYGVIPCFMQYKNKVILAAQSADTMTHPRHRYKGMFVDLAKITYDLCRKLGIRLIIGFPNQNSYPAGNKLGFKMTEVMSCFTIHINSLPLESVSKKAGFIEKLYLKYSRFVLKEWVRPLNGIVSSVLLDGFAALYRSDDYLNYKTYSPTTIIRVGDAIIWISTKHGLQIGDMEGINDMNFNAVINQLRKIAEKLGVRQLQFHCCPGTSLHRLFTTICPATPSFPVLILDFESGIPLEKIKFTFADIDIF